MKKIDLETLEEVKFSIDKHAFSPKTVICGVCKKKMVRLKKFNEFKCRYCKKKILGLEEANKRKRVSTKMPPQSQS